MKNWRVLVVLTLIVSSLSANAQRRGRHQDTTMLEIEAQNKISELKQVLNQIEGRLYRANARRLEKINQRLDDALAAIKPGGTNSGGGHGGGYPGGGYPGGSYSISITGSIENTPFNMEALDAADLVVKCMSEFDGRLNNVDEMKVSVDFSPLQRHSTSGWWKGEGEVCSQLAAKAISMGLPTKAGYSLFAAGSIEHHSFLFEAQTKRELMQQCTQFYYAKNMGSVDEMTVFDGVEIKKQRTSGWWSNSTEVCNTLIQQVQ